MHSATLPKGIFSAQWIPTDSAGRIDRAGLAAHLAFEKRAGVNGVLALGNTGEFPHFTVEEQRGPHAIAGRLGRFGVGFKDQRLEHNHADNAPGIIFRDRYFFILF